ncbi:Meiotically up-regulated gene 14 protein [Termitomyces sp. J132]|nr:Meiotically up-regulated gene 14 protein [Termitomyces sp. J132]
MWRGSKDGSIRLKPMPKFEDPYAEREWIKAHLAAVFRYWGKMGYADGNAGHITVRDSPEYFALGCLLAPNVYLKTSKLVLVDPNGRPSPYGAQLPINNAGFFIHSAIHEARPDIKAAAHCHSVHGKAWSVFGKPIEISTQDACVFYDNHSVYDNFGGVVLATEEGKKIARALGPKNKTCILQNHGLLTLGNTVDEAAHLFTALDKQCHVMLLTAAASSSGLKPNVIGKEEAEYSAKFLQEPEITYSNFQPEFDLLVEETNGAFLK